MTRAARSPPSPFGALDAVTVVRDPPTRFTTNVPAGTWPSSAFPVTFVLGPPPADLAASAAAELDVAVRTWPHVACTSYRARYGGPGAASPADDGVNVVVFHTDVWPPELLPGVAAQTVVHADAGGAYRDADIHLNAVDFRFSLDGAPGTLDLRSILVHELGHALGLGHSADPRATMYESGSGTRFRSLEQDDIDGVCALYPGTGAPGCEADPCPTSYVCVAGACQRPGERKDVCSPCAREPDACEAAGDDARCIDIVTDGSGSVGRVCGRACTSDATCGAGFHCKPTSTSGDLQCVSDDGCRNGASPCTVDADCKDSLCRGGACVGPADDADGGASPNADAGDGSADAGHAGRGLAGDGSACGCRSAGAPSGATASWTLFFAAAAVLALSARARSRRRSWRERGRRSGS